MLGTRSNYDSGSVAVTEARPNNPSFGWLTANALAVLWIKSVQLVTSNQSTVCHFRYFVGENLPYYYYTTEDIQESPESSEL